MLTHRVHRLLRPRPPPPSPHAGEQHTYISFLARLPLTEAPEMFGLHPNGLITRNLQDTKLMLDSLLATMSQVGRLHALLLRCRCAVVALAVVRQHKQE